MVDANQKIVGHARKWLACMRQRMFFWKRMRVVDTDHTMLDTDWTMVETEVRLMVDTGESKKDQK
jgi:hypothetical protein